MICDADEAMMKKHMTFLSHEHDCCEKDRAAASSRVITDHPSTSHNDGRGLEDNMSNDSTPIPSHCFLRISVAGGPAQNVVVELYKEKLPVTCRNFATLCMAPETTTKKQPLPTYRGTEFHRIVPKFMVQGGDFEKFDGTGGYSSFGGTFKDEGLSVIPHNRPGVVSMANRGKHTNGSQFFITLEATPHLDGKHVAFGQVVEGMNVIQSMANVELEGTRPVPMQRIVIVDCGEGRGPVKEMDSDSSEVSSKRKRKKKEKKRKKHSSKRRKRERRRTTPTTMNHARQASTVNEDEGRNTSEGENEPTVLYTSKSDESSSRRRRMHNGRC